MLGRNILKEVSQRAIQIRKKLTDKEFFLSNNVKTYFDNIIMVITKRFNRGITLTMDYSDNKVVAYTDFNKIYVNVKSDLVEFYNDLKSKLLCVLGLVSHECAHILFMSFVDSKAARDSLLNGKLYGDEPKSNEKAKNDLVFILDKSQVARQFITSLVMNIENIINDEHDENKMIEKFPGLIATSISYPKGAMHSLAPTFTEKAENDTDELSLILSLLFSYVRFGKCMDREEYQKYQEMQYVKAFNECKSYIDKSIQTDSAYERFSLINEILVTIWDYIFPKIKENDNRIKEKSDNTQNSDNDQDSESSNSGSGSGSNQKSDSSTNSNENNDNEGDSANSNNGQDDKKSDNSGNEGENSGKTEDEEIKNKSGSSNNSAENGNNEPSNNGNSESSNTNNASGSSNSSSLEFDESGDFDMNGVDNALKNIEKNINKLTTQKAQGNTRPVYDEEVNKESKCDQEEIVEQIKKDLNGMIKELSEEKAVSQLESERMAEIKKSLKDTNFTAAHNNISIIFNRKPDVNDFEKIAYNTIFDEIKLSSKAMQRGIKQILKDKKEGGKLYGEMYGKKFESKSVSRMDNRYFSKNKLQTEPPTLLVGMLVDESGSMSGERIRMAKKATIMLNDFTEELEIPTIIYGHSTINSKVDIHSYIEPEKYSKNDKYRLVNISSRERNRDGLALRIICERMAKRQEEIKLLFVISDGQPNHVNYYGYTAEEDMKNICKEFRKKGIKIFAAAIGEDKEKLHSIYGDYFLDITNLEKLPKMMVNLVKKHIQI